MAEKMEERGSFKTGKTGAALFKCKSGDRWLQSGVGDQKTMTRRKREKGKGAYLASMAREGFSASFFPAATQGRCEKSWTILDDLSSDLR